MSDPFSSSTGLNPESFLSGKQANTSRLAALTPEQQAQLLRKLREKQSQPPASWVMRFHERPEAKLRLFCIPYGGGGASVYRQWAQLFPEEIEVIGVQLPGRESRLHEAPYKRVTPLVEALAEGIRPYLDRPFAIYGHSMGALLSFALARQLRRLNAPQPEHLFVAAFRAPTLKNPNIKIYHLPTEVFKVVMRADGMPENILQNDELMQAILPTLRADFELCDTYVYEPEEPLSCGLSIFGGESDIRVRPETLTDWRTQSHTPEEVTLFPGSHFFLVPAQDQLISTINRTLGERLDRFQKTPEAIS